MTLRTKIALLVVPLGLAGGLMGQVRMRAGLWENTVTSAGKTASRKVCLTAEQEARANDSPAVMRATTEKTLAKTGACKLKDFSVTGTISTVVMVCGTSTFKNATTYVGDSFETVTTTTTPEGVKSSVIKGRRLGDCPAAGL